MATWRFGGRLMRRVHLESGLCETPGKLLTTTDPALVTCKRCLFPVSSRGTLIGQLAEAAREFEATPISERVPDLLERPVSAEALYEQGLSSLRKARNLFTKVWGMQPEGDGLRLSASMVLDRIDRILEDE